MKKSQIVFVGGEGSIPLWGHCSSCKDVKFSVKQGQGRKHRTEQEAYLRAAFDRHYMQVHLGEGAMEAAIAEAKRQA
jgi:hypothetical protein